MSNQPAAHKQAVTWRLHRDLVAAVQASAAGRGETVLAFVTRALQREIEHRDGAPQSQGGTGSVPPEGAVRGDGTAEPATAGRHRRYTRCCLIGM